MSSEMFLDIKYQATHSWDDPKLCCDMNTAHFAIIAKGNIIEGMEAKA